VTLGVNAAAGEDPSGMLGANAAGVLVLWHVGCVAERESFGMLGVNPAERKQERPFVKRGFLALPGLSKPLNR
jgi:hypothetical protein